MKSLKFDSQNSQKSTFNSKWLIKGIAAMLTPCYILATSIESWAIAPSGAFISATRNASGLSVRLGDRVTPTSAFVGQILRNPNHVVIVDGNQRSKAGIGLLRDVQGTQYSGLTVWAGPVPTTSEFGLCFGSGDLVLNWRTAGQDKGCVPQGFRVSRINRTVRLRSYGNTNIFQAIKHLFVAQSTPEIGRYCSSAANSGGGFGWGSATTNKPWDFFSAEDPCSQADRTCRQSSGGSPCSVMSFGEWDINEPKVVASFVCANGKVFHRQGSGSQVGNLLTQVATEAQGEPSCALSIYSGDDVVIASESDRNLVKTHDTGNGIEVNAIAGDIIVRSAKHPEGRKVREGEKYISPEGRVEPINRAEVANSPDVREALDPNNWLPLPQTEPPLPASIGNQISQQLGDIRTALNLSSPSVASNPRIPANDPSTTSSPRRSNNLSGEWVFDFGWVVFDPRNISATCRTQPERGAYQGMITLTQNGNQLSVSAPPEVPMISAAVSGNQFEAGGPVIQWRGTVSSDGNKITGTGTCGSASLPFTMTRRNSQPPTATTPRINNQNPTRLFVLEGSGVDNCLSFARDCGTGAANYFCQQQGYSRAINYKDRPARLTRTISSGETCSRDRGQICNEFVQIECSQN